MAIDTTERLYTFREVNQQLEGQPDAAQAMQDKRAATVEASAGLLAKWRAKVQENTPELRSAMQQMLDDLKGDLSKTSIDAWAEANQEKLQTIGHAAGLEGDIASLAHNNNGSFTVKASSGRTHSFRLADTVV